MGRWAGAAGAAVVLLLASCGGWRPEPVPGGRARSAGEAAVLRRGHDLHLAKCAKCHGYVDPRRFGEAAWQHRIMPAMALKAELGQADADAVLAYLLAVRAAPASAAAATP